MFKWLKQLFCKHVWYRDWPHGKGLVELSEDGNWMLWTSTCRKCGNKLHSARSRYG